MVFAKAMFSTYRDEQVMTMDGNIYLLQYGSYIKKEVMEDNVNKLDDYIMKEENGKYYLYVGASTILENAYHLKEILENQGIYTYIKNDYLGESEVLNKIIKLDKEMVKLTDNLEIMNINKEIMKLLKEVK